MSKDNIMVDPILTDPALTKKLIDICLKGLPILVESWWTRDQDDISNLAKALTGRSRDVLSTLATANSPQTVSEIRETVITVNASEANLQIIESEFSYRLLFLAGLGLLTRHTDDGQHVRYAISTKGRNVQALFR